MFGPFSFHLEEGIKTKGITWVACFPHFSQHSQNLLGEPASQLSYGWIHHFYFHRQLLRLTTAPELLYHTTGNSTTTQAPQICRTIPSSFLFPNNAFAILQRVRVILVNPTSTTSCVRGPQDPPPDSVILQRTHGTQHIVIFMAMIDYSERIQSKMSKDKRRLGQSPEETRHRLPGVFISGVTQDVINAFSTEL